MPFVDLRSKSKPPELVEPRSFLEESAIFSLRELVLPTTDLGVLGYRCVLPIAQTDCAFSTKEHPILALWDLDDCVGLIALEPKARIAFGAHSDLISFSPAENSDTGPLRSIHVCKLFEGLQARFGSFELEVIIAKGSFPEQRFIDMIRRDLSNPPTNVTIHRIREMDVSPEPGFSGCIAIDSQTGRLFSYSPRLNPYHDYQKTS